MFISKIKLKNKGYGGLVCDYVESLKGEQFSRKDDVSRTNKIPVSTNMRVFLDKLKYPFFNCSGHWVAPFDSYFDIDEMELEPVPKNEDMTNTQRMLRELWNKVDIVEVKIGEASFTLKATCEFVPGKPKDYVVGPIDQEDDYAFFVNTMQVIEELFESTSVYMNCRSLPAEEAKMYLENASKLTDDEINELSEEERIANAVELIEKSGGVVIGADVDGQAAITDGTNEVTVVQANGNSIDSHRINEEADEKGKPNDFEGQEKEDDAVEASTPDEQASKKNSDGQDFGDDIQKDVSTENPIDTNKASSEDVDKVPEKVDAFGPPAGEGVEFPIEEGEQAKAQHQVADIQVEEPVQENSELANDIDNW